LIYTAITLSFALALSLGGNLALFLKLKKSIKAPAPTQDAKDVLASLMQGQAIVQIRVMDPENLMLRSPRR
jgi:hypothetical protein